MKRTILSTAVILTVLAFFAVSCQKDKTPENQVSNKAAKTFYQPPQVDDMNAYLKDFKNKMQTRGNDDTMTPIEAAWHLSSVANYDFGDVVNDYEAFHYDTLRYNINVSNGKVSISDLNALYSTAADDIVSTFEGLCLDNKHIRFIGAEISDDGSVVMSILVSYGWLDHQWYFPDQYVLYSVLSQYYSEDSTYYLNGNFETELKRVLDILTGQIALPVSERVYYVEDRTECFIFSDHQDPYGSTFYNNSRIFAKVSPGTTVSFDEMLYCTDSYAGLGENILGRNEVIIEWIIPAPHIIHIPFGLMCHEPSVKIGRVCMPEPGGEPND